MAILAAALKSIVSLVRAIKRQQGRQRWRAVPVISSASCAVLTRPRGQRTRHILDVGRLSSRRRAAVAINVKSPRLVGESSSIHRRPWRKRGRRIENGKFRHKARKCAFELNSTMCGIVLPMAIIRRGPSSASWCQTPTLGKRVALLMMCYWHRRKLSWKPYSLMKFGAMR